MKNSGKTSNNNSKSSNHNTNGLIPNSLKFISSCIKTASSGVRSATASISGDSLDHKEQVLWASFDRLELSSSLFKHVLLLGYSNGFQVIDVEDASNVTEVVSRRDDPVTFLQMQALPAKSEDREGFRASHPLLLVVACDESKSSGPILNGRDGLVRDGHNESQTGNLALSPTIVRFYSLRSHSYVHVLRFRSTVYMVRCSARIVAVGLATQIYCFDALTLENKFSVLTYPVPQLGGQGLVGVNIGYGPMAVGPRWLAYASDNPLVSNTGRLSPQSLTPPLGVSPSTSPGNGSLVARYAMESSKQLAAGLINLGDMGYKTLSRYYDCSGSPVSSNSNWKLGRSAAHSAETDTAGMVVVKDFVSRAVLSQFRAHTSAISALCFDPSGTLLVTASIHGNNINIFRIMPPYCQGGSDKRSYDWSSSHVHLYKLHRGFTSAVIQDICFSHYSQWIAIVTSRGTCHIFVLSPFGGENVLQIENSQADGPTLVPVLSLPWWSSSSFLVNQQSFPSSPPSPVTLSVVSRIKNSNSGWLNTVSNAASTAAGKVSAPSGAIAAIFHSSVPQDSEPTPLKKVNSLEHLLVYAPSGHVVQYKLLSSLGVEPSEIVSVIGPGSSVQRQDEELRVNVEHVQWWDVCRRVDWPEREDCVSGITFNRRETAELTMDASDHEDDNTGGYTKSLKSIEPSHFYLSNVEVQMSSWRMPLWQKSKMYFHELSHFRTTEEIDTEDHAGGEIEIEKVPVHEIEIKQKDLLPVFDHFHRTSSGWIDRGFAGERYSTSSFGSCGVKESESGIIPQSKLVSSCLVTNSGFLPNVCQPTLQSGNCNAVDGRISVLPSPILYQSSINEHSDSHSFEQSQMGISPVVGSNFMNCNLTLANGSLSNGRTTAEVQSTKSGVNSEASNTIANCSDLRLNIVDGGPVNESPDFEQFFKEGYCKASDLDICQESTEGVHSNISPCDVTKSEEYGDSDDMLGGVFAFSEEGSLRGIL
uniref:Autophagy-related protein 18h-like n=1 Tax=Rhizophora mucronata TaxID=61149 RepID=A0A2P2IMP7_RHIMU